MEVTARSTESGANVQKWAYNGGNNQGWYFEKASAQQTDNDFILGSTDMTHFTEAGAKAVTKLLADELKKQGLV